MIKSVKLTEEETKRLEVLAEKLERTVHWLMHRFIVRGIENEEQSEKRKR